MFTEVLQLQCWLYILSFTRGFSVTYCSPYDIVLLGITLFLFSVGIGYASIVIVSLLNIYYIVILAWGLYYLFQCFQPELPWAKCNQPWNTDRCVEDTFRKNKTLMLAANITNFTSPVTEFWE